jgi:hypothetical protein
MAKNILSLTETAVAEAGDIRVGLSNVWAETFKNTEGRPQYSVRGTISVMPPDPAEGFDLRVAAGDQITIDGAVYQVVRIKEGETRGSATLEIVL